MGADRRIVHRERNGHRPAALFAACGRNHGPVVLSGRHRDHTNSAATRRNADRLPIPSPTAASMAGLPSLVNLDQCSAAPPGPEWRRAQPPGHEPTAGYMGPSLNLLNVKNIVAGATYQVSTLVLLAAPDSTNPTATLSLKDYRLAPQRGPTAASRPPERSQAPRGPKCREPSASAISPARPQILTLYIQSSSATDSFYIDDVTIGEIAPPPPNPSQQDNSGIASTFEDGGLDGWGSRSGSSTVTKQPRQRTAARTAC